MKSDKIKKLVNRKMAAYANSDLCAHSTDADHQFHSMAITDSI